MSVRIGAVHALTASMEPIEQAFGREWPEAEVINLCDQSLYADYHRWGCETEEIGRRVAQLLEYSAATGAQGILFSGSLFSESVVAARARLKVPVLTAYEAMIEAACAADTRLALLATVADTISAIKRDLTRYAGEHGQSFTLDARLVPGALDALRSGDRTSHNRLIANAASELEECGALMLAQHSMGSARPLMKDVAGRQILTSPDTAVRKLRQLIDGEG